MIQKQVAFYCPSPKGDWRMPSDIKLTEYEIQA